MKLWRYGYPIERLGKRYRLEGSLGSGGMADVCLAWDEREEREVAIKVVKADDLDQDILNRFQKEASQVVGWNHPHILHIYDNVQWELLDMAYGSIVPYIVIEYARGGDLQKRLKPNQPYPLGETLRIFAQLCSAVQYAHEQGVIHRDLKPHNILFRLLPDGLEQVVLSDFGLAVHIEATHHTFANAGTLAYMAPEQFRGQSTPSSDIFALGVILFQLCTGKLPFRRSLENLQNLGPLEIPPCPSTINPNLPKALDDVILTALSEDQARRFTKASLFWDSIRVAVTPPVPKMPVAQSEENKPVTSLLPEKPMIDSSHTPSGLVLAENSNSQGIEGVERPVINVSQPISVHIPATPSATLDVDKLFPPNANPANGYNSRGSATRSMRRLFLALAIILLSLLLIFGSVAFAAPGTFTSLRNLTAGIIGSTTLNMVTITPKSVDAHNTYVITGVTGTPDSTKRQVQARMLSAASQPESRMVSATGVVNTPGVHATGTLTFSNGSTSPYGVSAGTVFTDARGVQVTNDVVAYIPAGNPNTGFGKATVSAHAVNVGTNGNIGAFDFNNVQCCGSSAVAVSNTAGFSGGQDFQGYTAVEQSDVDGAANPLKGPLTQSALTSLQGQRHTNEQLVAQPQCTTNVTSNPAVGAKASSVTVTVTARCSAEVYDQNGAQTIAANLLKSEAAQSPGPGYALAGNVVTTVTQATVGSNGIVILLIKAEGIWVYQFSSAYKIQLAKLIAGKSPNEATALLLGQAGVENVNGISLSGGGKTLPTDATQITITVVNVLGIQGSPTPTGSPGSSTPASTISSPVPRPSPSSVPGK